MRDGTVLGEKRSDIAPGGGREMRHGNERKKRERKGEGRGRQLRGTWEVGLSIRMEREGRRIRF